MRWPALSSQTLSSSSYLPVYEDDEYFSNDGDDKNMTHTDRSKFTRLLRGLACWKNNKEAKSTLMDTKSLLVDDDLVTALRHKASQSSDGIPPLEEALHCHQKEQDIFVSKANNLSLWKRWWRTLSGKQQRDPLACQEDSNSTTDSVSDDYYDQGAAAAMASPHFSVSSNTRRQRTTTTTTPRSVTSSSDAILDGTLESIEVIDWPMLHVPQTNHELAKCLQIYTDRRLLDNDEDEDSNEQLCTPRSKTKTKRTVDFDQMSPMSDSTSLNADLTVSFDNQQECAQLIFQSYSDDDDDDTANFYSPPPLGAQFPHAVAAPKVPSVERQYVRQSKGSLSSSQTEMNWNTEDSPVLLEQSPSSCSASVEISLTDYENNAGWSSYDESHSVSSLLSSNSKLFQPICRYETTNPTESLLFVPPSYFSGCFTNGPTLLPDAKVHNDEYDEVTHPRQQQQQHKARAKHSMFFL